MSLPPIGTSIPFPGTDDYAILKYVGSVDGHDGVFCGLELIGEISHKGKNNGIFNNKVYFQVSKPGSGIFVPLRKVIKWISETDLSQVPERVITPVKQENNFDLVSPTVTTITSTSGGTGFVASSTGTDFNRESSEYVRRISYLENELKIRDNDLKELGDQLDDLDLTLKEGNDRLIRKEERFSRFREEKENEIKMLMNTIETLEKKIQENEQRNDVHVSVDSNDDKVRLLEAELEKVKEEFDAYKMIKNKEVNELRKVEMENYKLTVEIEKLKDSSADVLAMEELKLENQQLLRTIDDLKLDLENKSNLAMQTQMQMQMQTQTHSGTLPIFQPGAVIDASAGRSNFCTYCDRDGHDTEECPYGKDSMDMF